MKWFAQWIAMGTLAIAVAACTEVVGPYNAADEMGSVQVAFDADPGAWSADPMTVDSAVVEGDTLRVFVRHGGGCREHQFAAVATGGWMESYPVQVRVNLAHDARGDLCRALLFPELRFDLTPLRRAFQQSYQTQSGVVILRLSGAALTNDGAVSVRYAF